jgi:hypothetical protein
VNRAETLQRLKFLSDQVHQTAERVEHLPSAMPLHVHPESINWEKDLSRFQGEYNRLVRDALETGTLTPAELERENLPEGFHQQREG